MVVWHPNASTPADVSDRQQRHPRGGETMLGEFLWLAIVFFVLAIIAAAVGARGVAGVTMGIARIFVLIFIVLAIVALLL